MAEPVSPNNPSAPVTMTPPSHPIVLPPADEIRSMFMVCQSVRDVVNTASRFATNYIGKEPHDFVYTLWSDFEVISTKGGWAYGLRSLFTTKPSLGSIMEPGLSTAPEFVENFPRKKLDIDGRQIGFMICPQAIACAAHDRAIQLLGRP